MRKYNKFLIVCISLAVAVALFCGTFAVMGRANLLSEVGATLLYPFQWVFTSIGNAADGIGRYFSSMDELIEENESLRAENEELYGKLLEAEVIAEENMRLYGYLSMKEMFVDLQMCHASVIATERVQSENAVYITLSCGSSGGVKVNMPVVTPLGLVGYVCEVSSEWCRVKTLMSSGCVVSVRALTSDVSGMAKGEYSLVEEGFFRVTEIPEEAELVEGEIIVTRGDGKLYPASLPVGRVVRVEKNALNRTVEAVCSPFVDMSFESNGDVMVITGFETRDTETETEAQAEVE